MLVVHFCLNPNGLSRRGYREEVYDNNHGFHVDSDGFNMVNGRDPAGFDDTGHDCHGLRKNGLGMVNRFDALGPWC